MPEPEVTLDQVLERKRLGPGRPVETPLRGSTLGNCLRQQVALAQGVEPTEPIEQDTMYVFERGHTAGWYVGTHILDEDPDVLFHVGEPGRELELRLDDTLTAHIDQLVAKADGAWELWEVKSLAPGGLKWLGDEPKPEHATQAGIYDHLVREKLHIYPRATRVVYVTLGSRVTVKSFEIGPVEVARAIRVVNAAKYYLDAGRLPPRLRREPDANGRWPWPCSYCSLLTWCRGGKNGEPKAVLAA